MSTTPNATSLHGDAQRQYEQLVASIDGIVWEVDTRTFQFTFVSQQAERLLGYPLKQWYKPGFWVDRLHPDDRTWAPEFCARATREKRGHDFEYRMIAADGRTIWLRDIVSVVVEGERATKLRGIMVDITERKRTEAALQESVERLRLAVGASNVGLWDWNFQTSQVVFSREWKSQLGHEEHEIGTHYSEWERRLHPDDLVPTLAVLHAYLDGKRPEYAVEFRMRHKDGSYRWIYARGEVFHDASGQPARMVGCHVDITERKRAEEERQANLRFLESMDKVNRAIQGTNNLEQMLSAVLDVVLAIFDCDRAWLAYPCDPKAASWRVSMERTRPEFPGALGLGLEVPMDADAARVCQILRAGNGPVRFGPESEYPLGATAERCHNQSMIAMAVYPKIDAPYLFGLHQCSSPRVWTPQEERLFKEIGRRLADALSSLVIFRNLRESEERFHKAFHASPAGQTITRLADGVVIDANESSLGMVEYSRAEVIGHTPVELQILSAEERARIMQHLLEQRSLRNLEIQVQAKSGAVGSCREITRLFAW